MSEFLFSKDSANNAADYIVQYLRDAGYTGTLEKGTGVYDVMISLAAALYSLFKDESDRASAYLCIQRAQELKTTLGAEYDTVVDAILSNWFITRNAGTSAKGKLRLFFSLALEDFTVLAGEELAYYGATLITARYGKVFAAGEFTSVFNTVQNRTEFFIDVDAETSTASSEEIPVAASLTQVVSSIFLYRVEVVESFEVGEEYETSDNFIARAKQAITTRELITIRAISTVFGAEITGLKGVYIAGYGEPEMTRDIANFGQLYLHYGNKADIYVHADYLSRTYELTVSNVGGASYIQLSSGIPLPIVHIRDIKIGSDSKQFSVHQHTPTAWCSSKNALTLKLSAPVAAGTKVLTTVLVSEVASVGQNLVYTSNQRVVCYDPLVKAKYAAVCHFDFQVKLASGADSTIVSTEIKSICAKVLNDALHMDEFSMSKLLATLHTECWDILSISLGSTAWYTLRDPDTATVMTVNIEDTFSLPETVSAQVSANTVQLVTFANNISIEYV